MKEIRAKIADLTAAYQEQLQAYEEIKRMGSRERDLIEEGRLDDLLEALEEKQSRIAVVASFDSKVTKLQKFLVSHFQIEEFSISKLKHSASMRYKKDLESLEETISGLIPLLEGLEAQERENEALLRAYLSRIKGLKTNRTLLNRAAKAYGSKDPE